tara:strand:- start:39 stop:1319 length:1281 start_codon:yes stop_codon:yes gene_type:complete
MSNIPLLSNETSALFQTLSSNSSHDAYLYKLSQPYPNNSKQKIVVKPQNAMAFGSQCIFKIPRYGLLQAACLKIRMSVSSHLASTLQEGAIADLLGLVICDKIALTSHSKEIESLVPLSQIADYMKLNEEARVAIDQVIQSGSIKYGENLDDDSAPESAADNENVKDLYVYVPLMFSFSKGLHSALDVSFLEELEIVADVAIRAKICAWEHISLASSELICYFQQLDNSTMKKLQSSQFNLSSGQPLTQLCQNSYEENIVTVTGPTTVAGPVEATVDLACKHLCFETVIGVFQTDKLPPMDVGGATQVIQEIELFMSGRSIWRTTGMEARALEPVILGGSRVQHFKPHSGEGKLDIITLSWSNDVKRALAQMSGALSMKGASAPQLKITFKAAEINKQYDIRVVHKYYSAVSYSGSDGRISSGLNL